MALAGKLEENVELKASAEKFYQIFSSQAHQVPIASSRIDAVEVHEGDWETTGSAKLWKYASDGKAEHFKEKVEKDEPSKKIIFTAVAGHVLEEYKSYKATLQAIPKGEEGLVKVIVEYEKLKADDPPPNKYLGILLNVINDVDAHLVKA